jgi:hypothetical protein
MKNVEKVQKVVYLSFILASLSLLDSCVVYRNAPEQLSVSQIVQMSKDGKSSKEIIKDIRNSQTVYKLKASDYASLKNEGVQDSVLNYMDRTRIRSIEENDRYQNYGYWEPGWDNYWYGGFGLPYPYLGFGYGFGSTIIIHGDGGHHEGHYGDGRR